MQKKNETNKVTLADRNKSWEIFINIYSSYVSYVMMMKKN